MQGYPTSWVKDSPTTPSFPSRSGTQTQEPASAQKGTPRGTEIRYQQKPTPAKAAGRQPIFRSPYASKLDPPESAPNSAQPREGRVTSLTSRKVDQQRQPRSRPAPEEDTTVVRRVHADDRNLEMARNGLALKQLKEQAPSGQGKGGDRSEAAQKQKARSNEVYSHVNVDTEGAAHSDAGSHEASVRPRADPDLKAAAQALEEKVRSLKDVIVQGERRLGDRLRAGGAAAWGGPALGSERPPSPSRGSADLAETLANLDFECAALAEAVHSAQASADL